MRNELAIALLKHLETTVDQVPVELVAAHRALFERWDAAEVIGDYAVALRGIGFMSLAGHRNRVHRGFYRNREHRTPSPARAAAAHNRAAPLSHDRCLFKTPSHDRAASRRRSRQARPD